MLYNTKMITNNLRIKHNEALAQLNYEIARHTVQPNDVMALGKNLFELGFDEITDGFWVWDIKGNKEYYSHKFRKSLGFEGEHDFPSVPQSWMNQILPEYLDLALSMFEKHENDPNEPYFVPCEYRTKQGEQIRLYCMGTIVNREMKSSNQIMLGTHELRE